ncbi:hypothetical protein [Clostridium sp. AF32-12BH]|uniref:hypothetical protein n=1 Tax=Clostridium sp. AF32-12BH TaxID=2292006 RepID=UPI000E4D9B48|nr:hypothetical protein [Clostridium sp. AF32-12BH]RHP48494.1 hypothetical protein DWZ40_03975 [Clostridium sp. AF32-12BH]
MKTRLIIDGNAVYEIDEECEACLRRQNSFLEERNKHPEQNPKPDLKQGSSRDRKQNENPKQNEKEKQD